MTVIAGLLILALLGEAPSRTYYWRDAAGQTHITNTPPPSDAEVLATPPPAAVEPGKVGNRELVHQVTLSPVQQQAWGTLDGRLAKARSEGDQRTLVVVADSVISDGLWGHGLWVMPVAPVLMVALMGLLGWWLALGLRPSMHGPLVAGFLLLGLGLGHLLLNVFLYHHQAVRLRQNLELLGQHLGTGKDLRPDYQRLLQQRYLALELAADPLQPPWRFPQEVKALRTVMKQVMVEP